jgi:ATP-dependent DNA helicase RecQ
MKMNDTIEYNIKEILSDRFGYSSFRPGQQEVIEDIIAGNDVLALLPTGTGKSICYQLPAYVLDGLVITVSPLLSLMEDQVEQLKQMGEKRVVAFNSFLSYEEKNAVLQNVSQYRFLFISPESLQLRSVMNALRKTKIALFVIDEAHCISQWGPEFRTDYLKLAAVKSQLGTPPCLALTATAAKYVRDDIANQLRLTNPIHHIYSVDRSNIALSVEKVESHSEKIRKLVEYVKYLEGPGIIYTSSRSSVEMLTEQLINEGIESVAPYHGGMETEERLLIQRQFLADQLSLVCCTNAFGMGINKPNVRFVIHFHFPGQIESYLQEIGRAGRDGKESIALLLYHPLDDEIPIFMIEHEFPDEEQLDKLLAFLSTDRHTSLDESTMAEQFNLSETAKRFITYQLEEDDVSLANVDAVRRSLLKRIRERKRDKYQKVQKMKQWIETEDCRRKKYLIEFDEVLRGKPEACCDRCGIDLTLYERKTNIQRENDYFNWKRELKLIFQQV